MILHRAQVLLQAQCLCVRPLLVLCSFSFSTLFRSIIAAWSLPRVAVQAGSRSMAVVVVCLLYTSDAADE